MDKKQAASGNPNEISVQYNKLRQDYAQIFKVVLDLEEERKEHSLVLEALKPLGNDRKCWRLVSGVLVERTAGEIVPSLSQNIDMIDKALTNYNQALKTKERDIFEFEKEHGLKGEKLNANDKAVTGTSKATGVLA